MIAVLHAYSDVNLGDRLLVELTVARLGRLGIGPDDLTIVALDPGSFDGLGRVVGFGTAGRAVSTDVATAGLRSLGTLAATTAGRPLGEAGDVFANASGFVGVGGGYLRAGTPVEQVGVLINHIPQLHAAGRSSAPACYLPQSIGPLNGPLGSLLRSRLRAIDQVWLRDDTSIDEVGLPNCSRLPDLAVLDVADQGVTPADVGDTILLVARELGPDRPHYLAKLRSLADRLGDSARWAVQAEGATEKSDAQFYRTLGVDPVGGTSAALVSERPAVVVSVRLHGSIMSIAAGHPTIHLSYQRKGWAAMADLGLSEWCHDAGSFDPTLVAEQAEAIRADPTRYWAHVDAALSGLRAHSTELDETLAQTLHL